MSPLLGRLTRNQRKQKDTISEKITERFKEISQKVASTIIVNQVVEPYSSLLQEFFREVGFIGKSEWLTLSAMD